MAGAIGPGMDFGAVVQLQLWQGRMAGPDVLGAEQLSELAVGHHREDTH